MTQPEDTSTAPPSPGRPARPPQWLATAGSWAWPILLLGVVGYVLIGLVAEFKLVVIPILLSLLLVALLHRPTLLLRKIMPNGFAALIVLVLSVVLLGLVGFFIYGRVRDQAAELADQAGEIVNRAGNLVNSIPGFSGSSDDLLDAAQGWLSSNRSTIVNGVFSAGTVIGEVVTGLVLTIFLTFFLLSEGDRIWAWLIRLFPTRLRGDANGAGRRGFGVLSGWVTGTALIALIHAIVIGVVLQLLGAPLVLPLAVLLFIGSFIPIVGAFVFGGFAVLVTLVSVGLIPAVILLGVLLTENLLEGHVYQPVIIGKAVKLNSVAILLALTAGGVAAGLAGAIFAVPLAAAVHAAVKYVTGVEDLEGRPLRDEDRMEPMQAPTVATRRGLPDKGAHLAEDNLAIDGAAQRDE